MKFAFLALLFAIITFSSCAVLDRSATIYYNEEELSLADVTEMRHIFDETENGLKSVTLIPCEEISADETVYWLKSGSVWHKTYECRYIKDGSEVFYGTKEKAAENGKINCCSACNKLFGG